VLGQQRQSCLHLPLRGVEQHAKPRWVRKLHACVDASSPATVRSNATTVLLAARVATAATALLAAGVSSGPAVLSIARVASTTLTDTGSEADVRLLFEQRDGRGTAKRAVPTERRGRLRHRVRRIWTSERRTERRSPLSHRGSACRSHPAGCHCRVGVELSRLLDDRSNQSALGFFCCCVWAEERVDAAGAAHARGRLVGLHEPRRLGQLRSFWAMRVNSESIAFWKASVFSAITFASSR
jgi:hypothetical protein